MELGNVRRALVERENSIDNLIGPHFGKMIVGKWFGVAVVGTSVGSVTGEIVGLCNG